MQVEKHYKGDSEMINRLYRNSKKDHTQEVLFIGISVYEPIDFKVTTFWKDGYINPGECFDDKCSFDELERAMDTWHRVY